MFVKKLKNTITNKKIYLCTLKYNIMNKIIFFKLYLIIIILSSCKPKPTPLSGENALTAITVNDGNKDLVGNIAASNITFSDSAVAGTMQVTVKAIRFSDKASANVKLNEQIPINKTLAITAENGSIKYYAMTINLSTATTTGTGMTTTGNPMPIIIGTITGARIAIASITASEAVLSGSFTKLNNPYLTELGILVTANETLNLELTNNTQAPMGATKYPADASLLQQINNAMDTEITFSVPVDNLRSFIPYYFRGYAAISGRNIVYTNKINSITSDSYTSIPDDIFRNTILSCINTNGMTTLSGQTSEEQFGCVENFKGMISASGNRIRASALVAITQFNYGFYSGKQDNQKIKSLSGVEQMINLTHLNVGTNKINHLDVSEHTMLTFLNIINNQIASLDVTANTALTELRANNNSLRSLDVSANTALEVLHVNTNSLSNLDVSANTALEVLHVNTNSLSNLDVSANTALEVLDVNTNSLSSLDISANIALTELLVHGNSFSILDVSANTALTNLFVYNNSSLTCIRADASQLSGGSNRINTVGKDDKQTLSGSCSMTGG